MREPLLGNWKPPNLDSLLEVTDFLPDGADFRLTYVQSLGHPYRWTAELEASGNRQVMSESHLHPYDALVDVLDQWARNTKAGWK